MGRRGESVDLRRSRPTSADVAREAGVSRATVSYVLNDTPHQKIPEKTRLRVLKAAADLGYTPSAAARVLRSGRSEVILLLLPDWPIGPAVGQLLETMSTTLADAGLTLVVHPRARAGRSVTEIWKAITPAAVVAFDEFDEQDAATMHAAGVQLVVALLGRSPRRGFELEFPQQRIGRLQVEHLAATGHRNIGFAWDPDPRLDTFARARLSGARQACAELGLHDPDVRTVQLNAVSAAEAVAGWRSATPAVTGICAYNDETALAVLAGLRRLSLSAPHDLAVVGVDDIPAAALADPPLTTVVADQRPMAEHIARSIVANLNDGTVPPLPGSDTVQIVLRDSA
jgi:DNA-binding LacI/PurR family transcriptional regulator